MFTGQKLLGKKVVFYVQPYYINDKVAEMCHVRDEDLAEWYFNISPKQKDRFNKRCCQIMI